MESDVLNAEMSNNLDNTVSSEVLVESGLTDNTYHTQLNDSLNDTDPSYIINESQEVQTLNATHNESQNEMETLEHRYDYVIEKNESPLGNTEQTEPVNDIQLGGELHDPKTVGILNTPEETETFVNVNLEKTLAK